jgi:Cyclin M transmembrane N-terminal domain
MQNRSLPDREYYDDTLRARNGVMGVKALFVVASVLAGIAGIVGFRTAATVDPLFVHRASLMDFQRGLQDVNAECTLDCCSQYEEELCGSDENGWITAIPFGIQISLVVFLLGVSALFSGLTLGLMSLDLSGLEIVMSGDDAQSARYAKKIYPIRTNGNLLLCTLVLGNVAVNAVISILMANYTGGLVGVLSSTFLIVIFGEITPQAAVSCGVGLWGVVPQVVFMCCIVSHYYLLLLIP